MPRGGLNKPADPYTVVAIQRKETVERFIRHIEFGSDEECHVWKGTKSEKGYGIFYLGGEFGKRQTGAHRVSYLLTFGAFPEGLVPDHLCRNPACVNPFHLEAVTNRINTLRGVSYVAQCAKRTHCPKGHPYSGENLMIDIRGSRVCRSCSRAKDARRRAKSKEAK